VKLKIVHLILDSLLVVMLMIIVIMAKQITIGI